MRKTKNPRPRSSKRILLLAFLPLCCFSAAAHSEETASKISEALGHMMQKNLQSIGFPSDTEAFAKGMRDEASELPSSLSADECIQLLAAFEEQHYAAQKEENLKKAELFLQQNGERKEIHLLEDGKVQFEILKTGNGQTVQLYNSPLVRYHGKFLNEKEFGPEEEEVLALQETIAGLAAGVLGMQEGEIRNLYIHPELGLGADERLHPNSLLIFMVEVVKADASHEAHEASNALDLPLFPMPENSAIQ